MDKRTLQLAGVQLTEKKWSGDVPAKWTPPEGFFTGSAQSIVSGLLAAGEAKAMARLNFYINRAGKNLSDEDKARLEKAKELLHKKLVKEDLNLIRQLSGLAPIVEKQDEDADMDMGDEEEKEEEPADSAQDAPEQSKEDEVKEMLATIAKHAEGKSGEELEELLMKVYQAGHKDGEEECKSKHESSEEAAEE